jgi:hypothetical protein
MWWDTNILEDQAASIGHTEIHIGSHTVTLIYNESDPKNLSICLRFNSVTEFKILPSL